MKHIIIADESRASRMFIRRCLEIVGFQDVTFLEAGDGQEVLNLIREKPVVDLLVTDLDMPIMDGESLLRNVKKDPQFSSLPVLVITSAGNPAKEAELMALGAFAILNKPVSPADLFQKLKCFIQE